MALENVMKTVMAELRNIARTETVVGKEIQAGGSTIVPVSKISFGVAGGGASGKENREGTGIGGGASVEPIAFIVVTGGKAQLMPLGEKTGTLGKVVDLIPEVLEKLASKAKKGKKADEKGDKEK
jgi:uncharacterized spore protein YtfJ